MTRRSTGWLAAMLLACTVHATAQEGEEPSLSIELNSLAPVEGTCRLTFVATNRLGEDITHAAYEVVLFNSEGLVERLTVLNFRELPDGETRVRQFDLPDVECDQLGRILVNGGAVCDGVEAGLCMDSFKATTRTDIDFGK
jgi:hypothetical protein